MGDRIVPIAIGILFDHKAGVVEVKYGHASRTYPWPIPNTTDGMESFIALVTWVDHMAAWDQSRGPWEGQGEEDKRGETYHA